MGSWRRTPAYSLSFGAEPSGGPRWRDLVGDDAAGRYERAGTVLVLCDADGRPLQRNVNTSSRLVAIDHPAAQTFNICMDEPIDYRLPADHLAPTRGLPSVEVRSSHFSTWLDNTKAKFLLGWRPRYDLARIVDESWDYERAPDDPRRYPG